MAKTPTKSKKTAKKTAAANEAEPRTVQKPSYRSFRLQKRIKGERIPGAFRLLGGALRLLGKHWKLFLGIILVYGLLNALLVQGFRAGGGVADVKTALDELFTGNWAQLATSFAIFAYLLGSSGNTVSPTAGAYQLILGLVITLALIWTLRQLFAGHRVRIRDGFYHGMAPFVPFVLVLCMVGLQLIPMAVGLMLYTTVVASQIAVTGLEQVIWALLAFILSLLSLYMVASSIFALYIVALPNMTPLRALRSARQLVAHRRWAVMRRVIFLPIMLMVLAALVMIPLIWFVTPVASWAFFFLTMAILPVMHSYMYGLYRSLL